MALAITSCYDISMAPTIANDTRSASLLQALAASLDRLDANRVIDWPRIGRIVDSVYAAEFLAAFINISSANYFINSSYENACRKCHPYLH